MEVMLKMKIKDQKISKVCTELESEKYLGLASQSAGSAKLCCYAVKKLNENEIIKNQAGPSPAGPPLGHSPGFDLF